MIRMWPPRPVSTPPTEVAMREPPPVVSNSASVFFERLIAVPGKAFRYQSAFITVRHWFDSLTASSCP
ncbi:hypothetical protein [Methylobacterium brachythecii]|uniref:Uncharacterized protein n=1 Tax=Methylobacterium brachythecii TaxID=1176177 RepID=A0A7W6AHC1_9HYPH|nr:hypothetical protein [Methylobacterium brachythecii]MBB3902728.1 hypothetical protein [Methylobacterium brachythecii]